MRFIYNVNDKLCCIGSIYFCKGVLSYLCILSCEQYPCNFLEDFSIANGNTFMALSDIIFCDINRYTQGMEQGEFPQHYQSFIYTMLTYHTCHTS